MKIFIRYFFLSALVCENRPDIAARSISWDGGLNLSSLAHVAFSSARAHVHATRNRPKPTWGAKTARNLDFASLVLLGLTSTQSLGVASAAVFAPQVGLRRFRVVWTCARAELNAT